MINKIIFSCLAFLSTISVIGCSIKNESMAEPKFSKDTISGLAVYSNIVSKDPFITQIFLKDIEKENEIQITTSGNNSWPRWSPDGSRILFSSWTKENSFDIYLMNKDGSNQTPIISTLANELMADWSPDGTKITYVSDINGNDEIYIFDLISKENIQLTNLQFTSLPKWSPDGKQIAFISNKGVSGRSQVFVMNNNGDNIIQLTDYSINNFDGDPIWCSVSNCLIFTRYIQGVPKLMYLNLEDKKQTPLLVNFFDANTPETRLSQTPVRGYITFSVGGEFYAINTEKGQIYPLSIKALDLSLYP